MDQPPAAYDHPFQGRVVVDQRFGGEIAAWDGPCFPYLGAYACARLVGGTCYVYAVRGRLTAKLFRHEIAHCNGWRGDHPLD